MMWKQLVALVLAVVLVQLTCGRIISARTLHEKEVQAAEKVKAGISKLGTGKEALVRVKLRDGTKLDGYVSEANEDNFVVVDSKTGNATTVPYPQVKQVKGNNLSSGATVAIIAGALVAVVLVLAIALKGH